MFLSVVADRCCEYSSSGHPLELYENPAECYIELLTPGCDCYCVDSLADAYEHRERQKTEEQVRVHLIHMKKRSQGSCVF